MPPTSWMQKLPIQVTSLSKSLVTDNLNKADKYENRASGLRAPGISPEHLRRKGTITQMKAGWTNMRDIQVPGMRRCQEWTADLIDDLVKQKPLPETALAARQAVKAARHIPAD